MPSSVSLMSPSRPRRSEGNCSVSATGKRSSISICRLAAKRGQVGAPVVGLGRDRLLHQAGQEVGEIRGSTIAMPVPGKTPSRPGLPARLAPSCGRRCRRRAGGMRSTRLRGCGRSTGISAMTRPGIGREQQDAVAHQHRLLDIVGDHQMSRSAAAPRSTDRGGRCAAFRPSARRARRMARPSAAPWDGRRAPGRGRRAGASRPTVPSGRRFRSRRGRSGRSRRARACGAPSRRPRASRPISTFSSTVSQGNNAKVWNTNATCAAGPHLLAPDGDSPAGRRHQSGNNSQERRLSAAGPSQQCDDFIFFQRTG